MLRLIPRSLHRALMPIAHRWRHRWRRFRRGRLVGVSVFVTDMQGRLLLVRHSYGSGGWSLPGGGMSVREDPEEAARREISEEVGCTLEGVRVLETLHETISGSPHVAWLVAARTRDRPKPDLREILEARFFPTHSLPEPLTPLTRSRIQAWRGKLH
jgi:8-oxo-dGTP pyrophosphatase MutT (NUDIX family)